MSWLFLGAPKFEDPAADLQSRFLAGIMKVQLPFLLLGCGWAYWADQLQIFLALIGWLTAAAGSALLLVKRRPRAAVVLWSSACWLVSALGTVSLGGMQGPVFYTFLTAHMVGVLLFGYRCTLAWILLAAASTASVFAAETVGWIDTSLEIDPAVFAAIGVANVATAGFVLLLLVAGLQETLRAAQIRRERLVQRNVDLEAARSSLKQAVAERTERLAERNRDLEREIIERQETEAMLGIALDASEAAAKAKSEFLANMSHEIRTPLNGVLGLAESLGRRGLEPADREVFLRAMRSSGSSLLRIIDDVLDLSKLEAGAFTLDSAPIDLRDMIEDIFQSFAADAAKKNLELTYDITGVLSVIVTDAARLRQILVNLVGNAMKFTMSGGISVTVTESGNSEFEFAIRDTGIGIGSDLGEMLFEPFHQADTSSRRVHGGTGLGLAICRRLSELLGGRIWLESREGRGSTFYFTIRAEAIVPDTEAALRPAVPSEDFGTPETTVPLATTYPMSVLVAEDNEVNQLVVAEILSVLGYEPVIVANGLEAVEAVTGHRYDIVLMDIMMPEMDGLEATRQIRRKLSAERQPIILALTASVLEEQREDCLEAGVDGFLAKPMQLETTKRTLAAIARLRQGKAANLPAGTTGVFLFR